MFRNNEGAVPLGNHMSGSNRFPVNNHSQYLIKNDFSLEEPATRPSRRTSRRGIYLLSMAIFLVVTIVVLAVSVLLGIGVTLASVVVALIIAFLSIGTVHFAMEWEKCIVMRFGKFARVSGPGLIFTIPLVEFVTAYVDQRIIATPFGAEETLTSDLVPVNVDAVLFWMVWDPQKACTEVENYPAAVAWVAQTTMRNAVGSLSLAELATRREQLDRELKEIIEQKTGNWGITILSVEIRDILVPKELQDSMSKEAQAERERNARVILAEIERDISEMYAGASEIYSKDETALQLRIMSLVYESVRNNGGLVVVPSSFSDSFNGSAAADIFSKLKS